MFFVKILQAFLAFESLNGNAGILKTSGELKDLKIIPLNDDLSITIS